MREYQIGIGKLNMNKFLHLYMLITSLLSIYGLLSIMEIYPLISLLIFITWINVLLNMLSIIEDNENNLLENYIVII